MLPGLGVLCETWKCTSPPQNTRSDRETYQAAGRDPWPAWALHPRGWWGRWSHTCCSSATSCVTRRPYTWPSPTPCPCSQLQPGVLWQGCALWQGVTLVHTLLWALDERDAGSPSPCCLVHLSLGSTKVGATAMRPELSSMFMRRQLEPCCWLANLWGVWGRQGWWWVTSRSGNLHPILLLSMSFFRHSSP